ncbi:MAG: beta-propeller fold lactonase family protein, partial [Thermoplasmataceae archaeon]
MIEDMASTGTGILVFADQDRVDAVNNLSPSTANAYVLLMQGQQMGILPGGPNNTSVDAIFDGPAGFFIQKGFRVGDGTYQYAISVGGSIGSTGKSASLLAIATQPGSWTPLANSVTTILSSLPSGVTLTVTNPVSGVAGGPAETPEEYRTQILNAMMITAQGVPGFIKANLANVPGVNSRLISVLTETGGLEIVCGGGDPQQVAGAIYQSVGDITRIVGAKTTGILTSIGSVATTETNPAGVAVDPVNHFVFVANNASATIGSFSYNASTGILTSIGSVATGTNPLGISIDTTNHFVFVGNASA